MSPTRLQKHQIRFPQSYQLGLTSIGLPPQASIGQNVKDHSPSRTAQCLHPIARLKLGRFTDALDDLDHRLSVEHSGNVVGDCGTNLAFAARRQIAEQGERQFTSDGGKSVAVEE